MANGDTFTNQQNVTFTFLEKSDSFVKFFAVGQSNAHHDVAVAVDVFANGMHDNIGAESQRFLEVWSHERVVDHENT